MQRVSLQAKRRRALSQAVAKARKGSSGIELIIKTQEGLKEEVASHLRRIGNIGHVYRLIPYLSLKCDADYADILMKASSGDVSSSVFEKSFRGIIPAMISVDVSNQIAVPRTTATEHGSSWNLDAIGAYDAMKYGRGKGVSIAIIDTGVDYSHEKLKARFVRGEEGYDFVTDTEGPMDRNGHGTHVAGIVAGEDGFGVAEKSTLYSVRVLDENGTGREADLIAGIEWCISKGIDIVNMSLGSPVASSALEEICDYAWQHGLMLVAAAGNDGYGPNYPAALGDSVIAVAAVDKSLAHPDFSNIYETNDISAPGVEIFSTYPNNDYVNLTGTSMASPHVAGSLALAKSISSQADLEEVMKETARGLGVPEEFGAGLIRVDKMATYLSGNKAAARGSFGMLSGYLALEKAAGKALSSFANDAAMEAKGWFK